MDETALDDGLVPWSPIAVGSAALGRPGHAVPGSARLLAWWPSGPLFSLRSGLRLSCVRSSSAGSCLPLLHPLLHAGPPPQLRA